ncbi:uncharacterized mitochondrial protein AtMg00810-like [Beta vulgaris subsp. vulgaris]|uniref:uncharacterized mitochondrial protein AtMg00810-like n=1 Tax=Beta vulgaris subsp. vulgaris TaxID=3555 RepID=UPI0025468A0A|nr:uncharacterized mitochondrial protein AtMg00810-like [Beta vulgaris subsp. vulgaris]
MCIILVYVDDLLMSGDDETSIAEMKKVLDDCFTIKDLGHLRYFLGIEVARNGKGTMINQRKYALDIVKDAGFDHCTPATFPFPKGVKLSTDIGEVLEDPEVKPHMQAALHVVKYLKGTTDMGLFYSSTAEHQIYGYSDADWGTCMHTGRSLTGYCVFLGSSLVSWKTKKQKVVSKSSCEVELRSMSQTTSELAWVTGLLEDLHLHIPQPIPLFCDNKSAEYIAHNLAFHDRTKHLKLDCYYIRENITRFYHYISCKKYIAAG